MAKFAEVSYTADGATNTFVVPFGFIDKQHVKVYLDDALTNQYTWNAANDQIVLNPTPVNGVVVEIKRESSINTRVTDFNDGSKLIENDLDSDSFQALYLVQETRDLIENVSNNAGGLAGQVADNTDDINSNSSAISNNTNSINGILSDISDIEDDMNDLLSDIADIESNVADNISDILGLDSRVTQNENDIDSLDSRVTQNENDIAQNVSDIAQNASDITSGDAATLVAAKAYADAISGENLSPWGSGVLYEVDDVVEYLNVIYQCTESHTSGASFDQSKFEVISRVLTDAEVKVAYENNANTNAFTDSEKTKLSGIESGATGDMTDAEIKSAYENNLDTNAFTDSDKSKVDLIDEVFTTTEKSKLSNIEANATADQTASEIKAAYESNSDTNAFTDALLDKLNNIDENVSSGDGIDAYESGVSYAIGDIVHYTDNKIYKCTIAHTSGATLNQSNFQELSEPVTYTDAQIKTKYESNPDTNAFTNSDNAKLAGIESNATADQTPAEIKVAYESNSDTNAFTDSDKSKLDSLSVGGSGTYTNTEPTPETLGGIIAGTTFDNVSLQDIIEDLLYPYQVPQFTSFQVDGQSVVNLDIGETFDGDSLVFTWSTSNSDNIQANSIELNGVTGLANDGTETQTLSDETKNTAGTESFTIEATDTNGDTFSDSILLRWLHRRFYGVSTETSLNDSEVLALSNEFSSNHTKTVEYDCTGGRYFYFAFPQSFGQLTDTQINNLSWNDWVLETRNVVNSEGVSIPYYIYRSNNLLNGTITVNWS